LIINNKSVLFTINSNVDFYEKSLEKSVASLINSGISKDDILILISRVPLKEQSRVIKNVIKLWDIKKTYCLENDSLDYSMFNFLVERSYAMEGYSHFFYMHDTSWVGSEFINKLKKYTPEEDINSYALLSPKKWTMNHGLYKISWILSQPENVKRSLNVDISLESINKWKIDGAYLEGYLTDIEDNNYMKHEPGETITMENPFGSDTMRRTRYFKCLDLYKSQSNWDIKEEMNIKL
jgi:hypothetical protein